MKLKMVAVSAVVIQGLSLNAFAQNRGNADQIFTEPAKAGGTQVLLGAAELFAANGLFSSASPKSKIVVQEAEANLESTVKLPVTRSEYNALIDELSTDSSGIRPTSTVEAEEKLLQALKDKGGPFSRAEKAAMIEKAQSNLVRARTLLVQEVAASTQGQKIIKGIKIAGGSLLIFDIVGRIYVWNALDANPGFSPTIKYMQNMMNK